MTPTTVRDNLKALSAYLYESSGPDFMYEAVEQAIVLLGEREETRVSERLPLKPNISRFENWYIRYEIQASDDGAVCGIDADAWAVMEWNGETPVFHVKIPAIKGEVETDAANVTPTFNLWVKWDGCSHLRCPYLHFDEPEELEAFTRAVHWIRDDLADQIGMSD
jgi:hypothetical protein